MAGKKKMDGAPTVESTCTKCGKLWTGRMRWDPTYGIWRAYAWCIPCANEAARRKKRGLPPMRTHPNCGHCGADITHRPSRSRYCDVECRTKAYADTQVVKNREGQLRFRYRMTPERYEEMLDAQGGLCAICEQPPRGKVFDIDHDHACCPGTRTCGRCVRMLLCRRCNALIGIAGDSPALLAAASAYLARTTRREGELGLPA